MVERAFITGLKGTAITAEERAFLREASPAGLILFKRNIADPHQLKELIEDFREWPGSGTHGGQRGRRSGTSGHAR